MALANYVDLQATVANYLHRSDLATIIPDFITLAEKRINGDLNARLQDTVVLLPTVAGTITIPVPSDMIDIRSVVLQSSPNTVLDYLTPDQFNMQYSYKVSGSPRCFTVIGGQIYMGPIPDSIYNVQLTYRAALPSLATNGTNYLMTQYPAVYLNATLCEALDYIRDLEKLPVWQAKYKESILTVNSVDWYSGSQMRVRCDVRL